MTDGLPGTTAERLQIPSVQKGARALRLTVVVALSLAGVFALFVYRDGSQPAAEIYRAMPVERRDVVRVIEATGHLDARTRFEVPAPFPGRLSELAVKVGDRVQRGQVLARLDLRAGAFAVRNANASKDAAAWRVTEARTGLDSANQEQQRLERLIARGLASDQDLAAAKSARSRASAAVETARAQQAIADAQLASTKFEQTLGEIVAPIEGVVLVAPESLGAAVTLPERSLFVLGEPLELMRVDVDVGESDIGEVKVGQRTNFEVQAFPGRRFSARVERVSVEPRRENGVVSYRVLMLADNPERVLLPGMTAAVQLEVARAQNVLAVREAALRFTPPSAAGAPARTRLFRKLGATQLEAVSVTPGLSDGIYTQVGADDLREHDAVVVGLLRPDAAAAAQPGISLGRK